MENYVIITEKWLASCLCVICHSSQEEIRRWTMHEQWKNTVDLPLIRLAAMLSLFIWCQWLTVSLIVIAAVVCVIMTQFLSKAFGQLPYFWAIAASSTSSTAFLLPRFNFGTSSFPTQNPHFLLLLLDNSHFRALQSLFWEIGTLLIHKLWKT